MAKPKVISLFQKRTIQECFPKLNIMGRPQSMFIECQSYDVIIQVRAEAAHELDIFEDAVLRMIRIQAGSAKELADSLCLPADLVKLMIARLREKGYLSDAHTLSPQGTALLGKEKGHTEETKPLMIKLFRIPLTGQVLPYIHQGELRAADVVDDSKGFTLEFGSHGELATVRGRFLRCGVGAGKRLRQSECVRALEVYNRLADGAAFPKIDYLPGWAIDATAGERLYLHMQAAVQKGNTVFPLISDGFVSNVDGLMEYIDHENPEMLAYVRQNAIELRQAGWVDASGGRRNGKYREIYQELDAIQSITHGSVEDEGPDGGEALDLILFRREQKKDLIRHYAVMLEWAFFYYSAENPASEQLLQELRRGSHTTNAEILLALAGKLGIGGLEAHANLFSRVTEASVRRVERSRTPDFYVNFPLSLAGDAESGGGPLCRLLAGEPGLPGFLDRLFRAYRGLRHNGSDDGPVLELDELKSKCLGCVTALLPDVQVGDPEQDPGRPRLTVGDISNSRLSARVALEHMMGSMYFNSLPAHAQDDWMRISPDKDKSADRLPDPYNYINVLYRLLDVGVQDALAGKEAPAKELSVGEGAALAAKKWGSGLPGVITTVGEGFFLSAQNRRKTTLGASVLYYLCQAREDELEPLRKLSFVECAGRILSCRKHGNDVGLCVDEQDLRELREKVMLVTKQLGGF